MTAMQTAASKVLSMKRPCFPLLWLGLAGCTTRTERGEATVYSLAPWVVYSLVALGAVMITIGFFVVRRKEPVWPKLLGVGLLTIFPAVSWLAAYAAGSEYFRISDQGIEYRSGAFGTPRAMRFDDCRQFEFQVRQVAGNRGRQSEAVVPCFIMRDGTQQDINPVLLRGQVLDDLVGRLRKRGIPVIGDRRGL